VRYHPCIELGGVGLRRVVGMVMYASRWSRVSVELCDVMTATTSVEVKWFDGVTCR